MERPLEVEEQHERMEGVKGGVEQWKEVYKGEPLCQLDRFNEMR